MIKAILIASALTLASSAALSGDLPFYCKPLAKFERSCIGVKAAALTMGRDRAQSLARRCGATEFELQQARDCFVENPPQCPPEWQCNSKRDTNHSNCYAPACQK